MCVCVYKLYIYIYTYISLSLSLSIYIYRCIYLSLYVYIYISLSLYIYIYIYILLCRLTGPRAQPAEPANRRAKIGTGRVCKSGEYWIALAIKQDNTSNFQSLSSRTGGTSPWDLVQGFPPLLTCPKANSALASASTGLDEGSPSTSVG